MKCRICKVEAVALQSEAVTEVDGIDTPITIEANVYIPVCEEHKSDSTEDGMVIPLPGLLDLPLCAAYKRITELELRLQIEQLSNRKCNCPICCAKRHGQKSPISGECSTITHRKELQERLTNLPAGGFQCYCPECIDMRANHGQTRLQLREEVTLINKRLSESRESLEITDTIRIELEIETAQKQSIIAQLKLDLQNAQTSYQSEKSALEEVLCENAEVETNYRKALKFIRTYFTTYRLPGLEAHHSVCIDGLSDERLIELIKLGHAAYHSKMAIQEFVDTLE